MSLTPHSVELAALLIAIGTGTAGLIWIVWRERRKGPDDD